MKRCVRCFGLVHISDGETVPKGDGWWEFVCYRCLGRR